MPTSQARFMSAGKAWVARAFPQPKECYSPSLASQRTGKPLYSTWDVAMHRCASWELGALPFGSPTSCGVVRRAGMRVYFHLRRDTEVLLDSEGLDVIDLKEAKVQALEAAQELCRNDQTTTHSFSGRTLETTHGSGQVPKLNLAYALAGRPGQAHQHPIKPSQASRPIQPA